MAVTEQFPSLTVVIPNFNHGHVIGDQLRAMFLQSVQPAKLIIIDDGSTDGSVAIIRELLRAHRNAELIPKSSNSGVVAVLNEGLRLADTEYIYFSAADDLVLPGFFEKSLALLSRHPQAGLSSGVCLVRRHSGNSAVPNRTAYPCSVAAYLPPQRVRDLLFHIDDWLMISTAIFQRERILAAGGFDPELRSFADGFVSRVLALRHGACFIPETFAVFRPLDSGYSSSTTRDDDKFAQLLIVTNSRMATDFRELFPPELRLRCTARMLSRVLQMKLSNSEAHIQKTLKGVQPVRGGAVLLFVVRWAKRILIALLFCILRPYDIPRFALSKLWTRPPKATTSD